MMFQMLRRESGSRPLEASSIQQTLDPPQKEMASCSFRICPPLRVFAGELILSRRSHSATTSSSSSLVVCAAVLSLVQMLMCCLTVSPGQMTYVVSRFPDLNFYEVHTLCCGHIPKTTPSSFSSRREPASIDVMPAIHLSVVVLPPTIFVNIHHC